MTSRHVALLTFCLVQALGTMQAAPEKIPNDKVIHPLMKGVTEPQLIPESRVNPVYPEQWLKLHLGARVILKGVVEKSGKVREIEPLRTDLRVEESCSGEPTDSSGKGEKQVAPPEAAHDFELAATKAVKRWRYRPAEMNDETVEVFYAIIVDFTSCAKGPAKQLP